MEEEKRLLLRLLQFAGCGKRAEELSDALLSEFGSISRVFSASPERLCSLSLPEAATVLLTLPYPTHRHCFLQRIKREHPRCLSADDLGKIFSALLLHNTSEQICVARLDREFRIIDVVCLAGGTVNEASFHLRELAGIALLEGTAFLAVAHNHPEGDLEPSCADIETTRFMLSCLQRLGVPLLEHFVVCGEGYRPLLLNKRISAISAHVDPQKFYSVAMRRFEGLDY